MQQHPNNIAKIQHYNRPKVDMREGMTMNDRAGIHVPVDYKNQSQKESIGKLKLARSTYHDPESFTSGFRESVEFSLIDATHQPRPADPRNVIKSKREMFNNAMNDWADS